jgi:hypothetical protein
MLRLKKQSSQLIFLTGTLAPIHDFVTGRREQTAPGPGAQRRIPQIARFLFRFRKQAINPSVSPC